MLGNSVEVRCVRAVLRRPAANRARAAEARRTLLRRIEMELEEADEIVRALAFSVLTCSAK
jgi:hypothetical protein